MIMMTRKTKRSVLLLILLLTAFALSIEKSAQAEKPAIDCSKIRGVCYGPMPSDVARRELAYGKRVGLNAVRFWTSPDAFAKEGDGYIQKIVEFVRVCDENGYKSIPILFNGNMLNPKTIEPDAYPSADAFAEALVPALKNEPGLLMWDVMNEPLCNDYVNKSPKE